MKHIRETMTWLVQEITATTEKLDSLKTTLSGLERVFAAEKFTAPAPTPAPVTVRARLCASAAPKNRATRSPRATTTKAPRRPTEEIVAAVHKLPQPFGIPDLVAATGLTRKAASSTCHRWIKTGWLKRNGYGQFAATSKLPAQSRDITPAPASAAAPVDRNPLSRANLERELQEACQARDKALAGNHDKLAAIHQRTIDELSATLEKLP
jgi:hypothetical protein